MLYFYIFISVFIAWIWVDYYRLIDIYDKDALKNFILIFLIGCASVLPVDAYHQYVQVHYSWGLNNNFLNDFLFTWFQIGLLEELSKLLLFGLAFLIFRKQFTEPIDYIAYICTVALGFSAVENVFYFQVYGSRIIELRAILAVVTHMICAAIMGYGIIRHLYHPKETSKWSVLGYVLLAALAHGIYDFLIMYRAIENIGWFLDILYFFVLISVFATILNNAINNSSFFTYKKVIESKMVSRRLLIYYLIVFIIATFSVNYIESDRISIQRPLRNFVNVFIIIVTCIRLSRFKLIRNRWFPLKFELPFALFSTEDIGGGRVVKSPLRIKGESYNEIGISRFYNEYIELAPLSVRNSRIGSNKLAFIEKKIFLKNDSAYFLVKVHDSTPEFSNGYYMYIKPKLFGTNYTKREQAIVALLRIDHLQDYKNVDLDVSDFQFVEWVIVKPSDYKKVESFGSGV